MVRESWALERQAQEHDEALRKVGEKVIIRQIWTVDDVQAGNTTYCTACSEGATSEVQDRIAAVYPGQPGNSYCTFCYGTGFTGGFKPGSVYMYVMAQDGSEEWDQGRYGTQEKDQPNLIFTGTPILKNGDLLVRVLTWADAAMLTPATVEGRYQIGGVAQTTIRTTAEFPVLPNVMVQQNAQVTKIPDEHPLQEVPVP